MRLLPRITTPQLKRMQQATPTAAAKTTKGAPGREGSAGLRVHSLRASWRSGKTAAKKPKPKKPRKKRPTTKRPTKRKRPRRPKRPLAKVFLMKVQMPNQIQLLMLMLLLLWQQVIQVQQRKHQQRRQRPTSAIALATVGSGAVAAVGGPLHLARAARVLGRLRQGGPQHAPRARSRSG